MKARELAARDTRILQDLGKQNVYTYIHTVLQPIGETYGVFLGISHYMQQKWTFD